MVVLSKQARVERNIIREEWKGEDLEWSPVRKKQKFPGGSTSRFRGSDAIISSLLCLYAKIFSDIK
jgi:hypothetical protein